MTQAVETLIQLWESLFPHYTPPQTQFVLWVELNGYDITRKGIAATAKKYIGMDCAMTAEHMTRYASSCMINAKKTTARSTQEKI
jgi:hypothetical protein